MAARNIKTTFTAFEPIQMENTAAKSCQYGTQCFKLNCQFKHPNEWNACDHGVKCTDYECTSKHPPGRKGKCLYNDHCKNVRCQFLHPSISVDVYSSGKECQKRDCAKPHLIGRTQLSPYKEHCTNNPCSCLHPHPRVYDRSTPSPNPPDIPPLQSESTENISTDVKIVRNPLFQEFVQKVQTSQYVTIKLDDVHGSVSVSGKETAVITSVAHIKQKIYKMHSDLIKTATTEKQTIIETIELSSVKNNFLEFFGNKILDTIRREPYIKDANVIDGKLQLSGTTSAITNVKSYLKRTLHEQSVIITNMLKKYLTSTRRGHLLKRFLQKYHVGNSFENAQEPDFEDEKERYDIDRDVDEYEDESDDAASVISNTSSSFSSKIITDKFQNHRNHNRQHIKVTLCSDSEGSLSKAITELQSYSLQVELVALTQNEIGFILKQQQRGKPAQSNVTFRDQCFQIKTYLIGLIQSIQDCFVWIFVFHKSGVWHVKVMGFKQDVDCAVSKIKGYLNDIVETELQIPISKTMAVFLRTKASSDIRQLEKYHRIKIIVFLPPRGKHWKDTNDERDDDYHCLKLNGSSSNINLAQGKVESFLDSLSEQEKHFPCDTWDISKNISHSIVKCLTKIQNSQDYDAIGFIKFYTALERRETAPKVSFTVVSISEDMADDVIQQCTDIIEGYVVWKPSADEYRTILNVLKVKRSPSIEEFQQQWDASVQLDRYTSTIIIFARSKMIADEMKDALLGLAAGQKVRMDRISELIEIPLNIRRFVKQAISFLLDEAKAQTIFVESKNRLGLTLRGHSDIVTVFKEKINVIINDIKQKIITHSLKLSLPESDLMRINSYQIVTRIERETNTIVRDVKADISSSTLKVNEDANISLTIVDVVNSRGQTIIVQKGDITKATNVDAIVNAANGPLYHAGGVDKAIADAAGPALDQECKQLIVENRGLPISAGKAVKTTAGNLPFKCVIHAIGPQYIDGNKQERPLLFHSILSSLRLAESEGYTSVALPAISANTYGFPMADCTNVVVRAVKQFFADYPQSIVKKVVLLDIDDTACNSFAREVVTDHRNTMVGDNKDITNYELPPLTAKWCWQSDYGEHIYNDDHIRQIETEFQKYLATSIASELKVSPDNYKSGTIVDYFIQFLPNLKQTLTNNPSALNARLVCGHQKREDTGYRRNISRYPVVQQYQPKPVIYHPKPLDSYDLQVVMTEDYWNITGITSTAVQQAQQAIRTAIDSATISETFFVQLDKDLDVHKAEITKITTQQMIRIDFQQQYTGQLQMILKGLKPNVSDAKLRIALYAQDILKVQADKNDELRIPKEWGDQKEGCELVDIPRNHPDFTRIENRMKETMNNVKIDKIERVQNERLWSHYAFRRRQLKQELSNMPDLQIEMELFHGTKTTKPSEIYNGEYGFDMTFSTSGMWGLGTYFAKNASYSCGNYAHPLPNSRYQVFFAQVLTGDVHDCKSDSSLRRPPKKNEAVSGTRYNSVSGETGRSKVYIVYENRVAYPNFLITFSS